MVRSPCAALEAAGHCIHSALSSVRPLFGDEQRQNITRPPQGGPLLLRYSTLRPRAQICYLAAAGASRTAPPAIGPRDARS
jgi:hypothetical protein